MVRSRAGTDAAHAGLLVLATREDKLLGGAGASVRASTVAGRTQSPYTASLRSTSRAKRLAPRVSDASLKS